MFEAIVIGNVGSVKLFSGATPVLNVNVAASRRVGDREYTDWVSVKIWGERALKLAAYIHKGMRLLVRGRPEAKAYAKQDGTMAGELIVHANDVEFLSAKPKLGDEVGEEHAQAPAGESELPLATYNTSAEAAAAAVEIKTRRQRRN